VQIAIPSAIIPIVIAAFAAYALSWMKFKGRDWLFVAIVAMMVVPLQMCLIPLLKFFKSTSSPTR
jgi:alpha-glucoside transport system permease protein